MKKFLITQLFCLLMMASFAEGYQVNLLSARQSGMGHTGVALKLGAESMHFNPAGLVFMKKGFSFSAGVTPAFSFINYINADDKTVSTDNPVGTPFYLYAAYKPMDDFAFGLSLTTPYGNSLDWGKNWAGAHMVQSVALKSFVLQPTVSYKILDNLSIGAGAMIMYGNFDLNKGLIAVGGMEKIGAGVSALAAKFGQSMPNPFVDKYQDIVPVSANLKSDAELYYAFNVGILYDLNEKFSFGLSYRSKMLANVKGGDAKISYYDKSIEGYFNAVNAKIDGFNTMLPASSQISHLLPSLNTGNFDATLPMPANTTFGLAYKANEKLTLTADLQFVEWSIYKNSKFDFYPTDINATAAEKTDLDRADVTIDKNFNNTFIYRLGAQYIMNDIFVFRAGAYFDETPCNSNYYNPETPGMDKLGLSLGSTITLMKGFNIDMSMTYINGFDNKASVTDPNKLIVEQKFSGTYNSYALIPSIGLSYSF